MFTSLAETKYELHWSDAGTDLADGEREFASLLRLLSYGGGLPIYSIKVLEREISHARNELTRVKRVGARSERI